MNFGGFRFLDGSRILEPRAILTTRRHWQRRPESRSPLWRAAYWGRWVLALSVDVLDPAPFDPDRGPSSQGRIVSGN